MTVCLHAPDCVLLLELKILNEFRQKLLAPRHLLETWEQAWLAWYWFDPN
jgi:hypothetical protein